MKNKNKTGVFAAVRVAAVTHRFLTAATLLCVVASVAASLVPPLLLSHIVDRLAAGASPTLFPVLPYFGSLALGGLLSSAQETLLVLFGQKMTHALRSEMSQKLIRLQAGTLAAQNPGEVAARFSGDVDTVEALFTSGIISMVADACRILSILAAIAVKNTGLALVLLVVLPLFAVFTRHVQKRMLAAQLENRRAVAAVSSQVPETLHNIRTIHALGLESYMERRYKGTTGGLEVVMRSIIYAAYSKDLSVKTTSAKIQMMKQGKYVGGYAPYGYVLHPTIRNKLAVDPEAADVIRRIFREALEGSNTSQIARSLNGDGIPTPGQYFKSKHPDKKKFSNMSEKISWETVMVYNILKNLVYTGTLVSRKMKSCGVGSKKRAVNEPNTPGMTEPSLSEQCRKRSPVSRRWK